MTERVLSDWLDSYLEYTKNTESPISYHIWCGLSVIAGALQRRVYLKWGLGRTVYPNVYVVLVGPSGRTRKGVAIGIAKEFLRNVVGVTVTPESSSGKQAMIMAMKRAISTYQDPTDGVVKMHSAVTAFSEELAVFLGQGDISYLSSLTDWYDSKDEWEYETISRGKDTLQGLCLTLVGGTAPDWIQSMIPQEALGGGFTSRIIFIVEEKKRQLIPEYLPTQEEIEQQAKLREDLDRIGNLMGEVTMEDATKKLYTDWYCEQDRLLDEQKPPIQDSRFAGYCERRATHLQKLMIICSASRGDDLKLTPADFNRALALLTAAEANMHKTFGGLGKARISDGSNTVMDFIKQMGITTRSALLQKFFRDIEPMELEKIETQLVQMHVIEVKIQPEQKDKVYKWIGD